MKKIISIFLSIILLLSVCTIAFASDEQIDYLLLGDSIASGVGVLNRDEACYGKMVCNTNGYNYINDAVSGYEAEDLLKQIEQKSVQNHIKNAEIINISIGGNDVRHDNILWLALSACFGNTVPLANSVNKFYDTFAKIMDRIIELNPEAVILVQTVYNPYGQILNGATDKGTDILNEAYEKYLELNPDAYTIVDIKSAFEGQSGCIALDTFHPSGKGNKIIAKEILKVLKNLGLGEKTEPVILVEPVEEYLFPVYWLYKLIAVSISAQSVELT